jgi:hypothetical protein
MQVKSAAGSAQAPAGPEAMGCKADSKATVSSMDLWPIVDTHNFQLCANFSLQALRVDRPPGET